MSKKPAANASPNVDPKAPPAPVPAEISFDEAAKLVKRTVRERKKTDEGVVLVEREVPVKADEIFAVNEYPDRYHVITKDGQKLVAEK